MSLLLSLKSHSVPGLTHLDRFVLNVLTTTLLRITLAYLCLVFVGEGMIKYQESVLAVLMDISYRMVIVFNLPWVGIPLVNIMPMPSVISAQMGSHLYNIDVVKFDFEFILYTAFISIISFFFVIYDFIDVASFYLIFFDFVRL